MDNRPIGVFDSGVGGLSFLRRAKDILPYESFIYFGDSLNAPYGTKSREAVLALSFKNADMLISKGVKAIVIACNTATSIAVDSMRKKYDVPIISMEPAIKPALEKTCGRVLLMATVVTLNSVRVSSLIERFDKDNRVIKVPCTELAEKIEQSALGDNGVEAYLEKLLSPYKSEKVESVVLGCTHYPFVAERIKRILNVNAVFDGIDGTANHLKEVLNTENLACDENNARTVSILSSKNDAETNKLYNKLYTGGSV